MSWLHVAWCSSSLPFSLPSSCALLCLFSGPLFSPFSIAGVILSLKEAAEGTELQLWLGPWHCPHMEHFSRSFQTARYSSGDVLNLCSEFLLSSWAFLSVTIISQLEHVFISRERLRFVWLCINTKVGMWSAVSHCFFSGALAGDGWEKFGKYPCSLWINSPWRACLNDGPKGHGSVSWLLFLHQRA